MRTRLWICSTTLLLPLAACATRADESAPAASPGPQSETETASSSATASPAAETPEPEPTLTFKNSRDLAILLEGPRSGRSVARFASRNEGIAIEFDAHVVAVTDGAVHLEYGDHGSARRTGPTFELRDLAATDLGLESEPAVGDDVRLVARVGSFESDGKLLLLDPLSITPRS